MPKRDVSNQILAHLDALNPKVSLLSCEDESSPDKTVAIVPVARICYFTTETPATKKPEKLGDKPKRYEVMIVTDDGRKRFTNTTLAAIESALADQPRFFRSAKAFYINTLKITESRTAKRGRDLRFEGSDDWVLQAVGEKKFLDDFKARFVTDV